MMTFERNLVGTIVKIVLVLALSIGQQACSLYAGGLGCDDASCMPPPEQSSPNSYTCSCSCKPDSRVRELRILAGTDDAEQNATIGTMSLASLTLDMPTAAGTNLVGLRFPGLAIPPGSHIVSAQVQFTSAADSPTAVSLGIAGEASDNAAPFAATSKNLSSRPFTNNGVSWAVPGWKKDAQGADQMTPSLEAIVQEIVDRPGWADGNAIVLLIKKESGAGSRSAHSYEAQPLGAALLTVKYDDPSDKPIGPQDMPVCMLPSMNANLGGVVPQQDALQNDCQYRVGAAFTGMAEACSYPSNCGCVAVPNTKTFAAKCDDPCVENPLAADCKNFDPVHDHVEATNAPGDDPVCVANCPLSFNMYGRRSECLVEGTAHVGIGGEEVHPSVTGIVQFRGDPCPEGNCAVGIEYDLDLADVRFETLFHSESFEELTGIGESLPGNEAVLSRLGEGTFAPGDLVSSARGRRGREQQALTVGNLDPVNVSVKFGYQAPSCSIHGKMVGGPASGEGSTVALGIDLRGRIVNQPPTAEAGQDQIVQCPARIALDGSASTDLDGNLALYTWLRGSRAGAQVGFDEVSQVEQRVGTETYVLRVIDTRGQTDEDSTEVTVVDTTSPEVRCDVRVPVLSQTNHGMADVGLGGGARDACEGQLPVRVEVFSDESDDPRAGDGNLSPDGQNVALGSLRLRQERQSRGDGRVYLIRAEATDAAGNRGVDCCTVVVPHSNSRASLLAVQKQATAARSFCRAHQGAAPVGFLAVEDGARPAPKR
jgi:hypothetical protein